MTVAARDTVVSLRYRMTNRHGEVLEDRLHGAPVLYLHGSDKILPSLQREVEGLQAGDEKLIEFNDPQQASCSLFVIVDSVRAASEEELLLGYPLPGNPEDCGEYCDCRTAP